MAREQLWDRAHEIAAGIAAKPTAATQGTVRAIWESLDRPYRAAMEQGLIYTRLGNPDRDGRGGGARDHRARAEDPVSGEATPNPLGERIAAVAAIDPSAPAIEFAGRWRTWGEVGATVDAVAALVPHPGAPVGVLLRNRPAQVATMLGVLRAGGCLVTVNPGRGEERTRDDIAGLDLPLLAGGADDLRGAGRRRPPDARGGRRPRDEPSPSAPAGPGATRTAPAWPCAC